MKIDWGGKLVLEENCASEDIRCIAESGTRATISRTGNAFLSVIHPDEDACSSRDCDSARSVPIGRAVRCYHCADGGAVAAGKEESRQSPEP
jgi:hypothetical protein